MLKKSRPLALDVVAYLAIFNGICYGFSALFSGTCDPGMLEIIIGSGLLCLYSKARTLAFVFFGIECSFGLWGIVSQFSGGEPAKVGLLSMYSGEVGRPLMMIGALVWLLLGAMKIYVLTLPEVTALFQKQEPQKEVATEAGITTDIASTTEPVVNTHL